MDTQDIEWVSPATLASKEKGESIPQTETLNPTAYLHTLYQQSKCCANELDDYIQTIQQLINTV